MTPPFEFLVNDRQATLRREADQERLARAAIAGSRRGRRGPLAWFLSHRPGFVRFLTRRARLRLGRGQA